MREAPALRVGPAMLVEGAATGALAGLTYVAKDVIDVAGVVTGAGNPLWLSHHEQATESAPVVRRLSAAGAACVGKAHTDELAFSLAGSNAHYGAPPNPAAPGRFAGGSSSGSAAAVAAGLSDFALGTDTGGSIRVPASYCGLIGFRPTHGRIEVTGVLPLAPTFDTVGILSREVDQARAAAAVLLTGPSRYAVFDRVLIADGALAIAEPDVAAAVLAAARDLAGELGLPVARAELSPALLGEGARAFMALQGREAWACHGAWVERNEQAVGVEVAGRFRAGSQIADDVWSRARATRLRIRGRLADLLAGALLVLPSAPSPAPLLTDATDDAAQARRAALLQLTCLAGLVGAPAVSLPLAAVRGLPVGVGLVATPGADEALLHAAGRAGQPGPAMSGS